MTPQSAISKSFGMQKMSLKGLVKFQRETESAKTRFKGGHPQAWLNASLTADEIDKEISRRLK